MNDVKRATWHLRRIPLLAELGVEAITRLAERTDLRELRRREVVYLPGDPGDHVFFLSAGRVKISKVTRDGKSLTLAYVAAGEPFGEACLEAGAPRTEMAEAADASQLLAVERGAVDRLLANHPGFGHAVTRLLLTRRRELEQKLEALVFRDVSAKLAEQLIKLAGEFGVEDERGTLLSLKITHQELANLIGSTRETVSLTLSEFKRQRYIGNDGRRVILLDRERLRAMY
ncbi:MAG: Crp/Fnr family transcriptional regulator [Kofleriaceae bacterium]